MVNLIVEQAIAEPREVEELYATLPAQKRDAIHRRTAGRLVISNRRTYDPLCPAASGAAAIGSGCSAKRGS